MTDALVILKFNTSSRKEMHEISLFVCEEMSAHPIHLRQSRPPGPSTLAHRSFFSKRRDDRGLSSVDLPPGTRPCLPILMGPVWPVAPFPSQLQSWWLL